MSLKRFGCFVILGLLCAGRAPAAESKGFIRTWLLCGAFQKADLESPVLPGEAALDPKVGQTFQGKKWKSYTSSDDMIDFANPLSIDYHDTSAAYAFIRVYSEADQAAVLLLGSDDGIRVWLNGEEVLCHTVSRPHTFEEEKLSVRLKQGWNRLLLKIRNDYGGWSFSCRIAGPDGKTLEGLKLDPAPEALDVLPVRKVTVSSAQDNDEAHFSGRFLADGDRGTRWSSGHSDQQFAVLDFGAPMTVSRVSLFWENAYAEAFKLEVSNDKSKWKPIYETETGTGGETAVLLPRPTDCRYLRLTCLRRGTPWGYSLWEMTALGKSK